MSNHVESIVGMLADEENQPHQYVGRPDELINAMRKGGLLEFAVRQTSNGYIIEQFSPISDRWIFRSAEEMIQFVATKLVELPH